uniref:SET domain-containing protein n=1 Tax=Entomoneis paludosa TaxID=265537 RepID=A0A7S2YLY0_9STRA
MSSNGAISLDRGAPRQVLPFQEWAANCGVQVNPETGFCLQESIVHRHHDVYAATSTGAAAGSVALYVPGHEIQLSSQRLALELASPEMDACSKVLDNNDLGHLYPHFLVWIKVLQELQQGADSPYFQWWDAMPRTWNTAASMDEFCLTCLPPYLKQLCQTERDHLQVWRQALELWPHFVQSDNEELLKFAYNVVMTRSVTTPNGDVRLVPVVDCFNHAWPEPNAELQWDEGSGDCQIVLTQDVGPGEALSLDYGQITGQDWSLSTNPAKFLATYGFLDANAPATFCKLLLTNPSSELIDMGYEASQMLFYTADGGIAPAVWDVLLYSRLERKRDDESVQTRQAFYQAHLEGNEDLKQEIHQQYAAQTTAALLRHVQHILIEIHDLTVQMNVYDSSAHPRLPLLLQHHAMVTETFEKVRDNLLEMQEQMQ